MSHKPEEHEEWVPLYDDFGLMGYCLDCRNCKLFTSFPEDNRCTHCQTLAKRPPPQ